MTHPRKFRFAAQLSKAPDGTARSWADQARKAEDLGYSTLLVPDHFGDQLAPVPALMAAADATSTLRIGTLVFDNDYRHPVVLAKEAATFDLLSGGRLELGLGAGWMRTDYEESGITYDAPGVRVDRFAEGVAVIAGLARVRRALLVLGRALHRDRPHPVAAARAAPPSSPDPRGRRPAGADHRRAMGRHRQHQRRPPGRDGRARSGSQRLARRHPSEGRMGQEKPPGPASTTSSSIA